VSGGPVSGGPVNGPYGEPLRPGGGFTGGAPAEGDPARSTRDDLAMNPLDSQRSGLWTRLFGRGE